MRFARLTACVGLVGLLLAVPAPAVDPSPPAPPAAPVAGGEKTRTLTPVEDRKSVIGRQRAVVIGINYLAAHRDTKLGKLDSLRNAENDARAVASILADAYGYRPAGRMFGQNLYSSKAGDVRVIAGASATRQELGRVLLNPNLGFDANDPLTENDSVLVYFSGHGCLKSDGRASSGLEQTRGFLLPVNAETNAQRLENRDSAIDLSAVVSNLAKCPAKHKLLILDCCHSGAVFHLETGTAAVRAAGTKIGDDLLAKPSFHAMTATRTYQVASDGSAGDGNSPYTANLLRALTSLGLNRGTGFTATDMFHEMQAYFANLPLHQSPEYRTIDGDGEFPFVPAAAARFPGAAKLTDEQRRVLMALTPSTFGYWWADEMPWFMPCLRLEIMTEKPADRGAEPYLDAQAIRQTAENWAKRNANGANAYAARHLRLLLDAKAGTEWAGKADQIIGDLRKLVERPALAAGTAGKERPVAVTDLLLQIEPAPAAIPKEMTAGLRAYALNSHFLAVLYHKRNQFAHAQTCYLSALRAYGELAKDEKAFERSLLALCQVDYGVLCLTNLHQYKLAEQQFQTARQLPGCPAPFEAYTLYREAEAHRRQGLFGRSDQALCDAFSKMTVSDPKKASPLFPAVLKHHAWAYMEACRFTLAQAKFEDSKKLFEARGDFSSRIEAFHCRHGLAMIERFHGRDDNAVAQYRQLNADIAMAIDELDNSRTPVPNYTEVRQLLFERYVNSLERQADCRLFSRRADPVEAADDYRRAGLLVSAVTADRREEKYLELDYRRIMALALPDHRDGESEPHDLELAADLFAKTEAGRTAYLTARKLATLPDRIELLRATAAFLVTPAAKCPDELKKFLDLLAKYHPNPRYSGDESKGNVPDRDELERLMFGYRLLLNNAARWNLSRFQVLECGEQLLSLCRAAVAPARLAGEKEIDYAFLKYLRHDYDAVFVIKAGRTPAPVKELIEIAWEATRGTHYVKPAEIAPTFVLFRAAKRQYVLIDVPPPSSAQVGVSKCLPLAEEWSDLDVLNAATAGTPLPLPREVRQALAAIKYPERRGRLHPEAVRWTVRWRDPVWGIGMNPPEGVRVGYRSAAEVAGDQFPFRLGDAIPADRYSDKLEREYFKGVPALAAGNGGTAVVTRQKPADATLPATTNPLPVVPVMPQP